jgi:drug/metabolite transporter (DMT)-like permease
MYFSLQHLSLSDATVLTFIAPILTGFSGAVFLKESLSIGEVLAGCEYLKPTLTVIVIHQMIVCSFLGVVLVSRPQFLFGSSREFLDPSEGLPEAIPAERMLSVL